MFIDPSFTKFNKIQIGLDSSTAKEHSIVLGTNARLESNDVANIAISTPLDPIKVDNYHLLPIKINSKTFHLPLYLVP